MQNRIMRCTKKQIMGKLSICLLLASLCSVIVEKETFADGDPVVRIDTTRGPIFCRIFRSAAPMTSANFLNIASTGFYSGKIFHRIENWCIQGGDPNGNGTGDYIDPATGAPRRIQLEINRNLRHTAGTLAMARQANNPNSASCQFYITKCPMYQLDGKYAIFGRVVGGMEAVQSMRRGDMIQNVSIVQTPSQPPPNANHPNGGQQRRRDEPVVPYEPPSEIPDSNF